MTPTPEQALETYKNTVRDNPRDTWANWIIAVSNSLAAGEWIGGDGYDDYAKKVFEMLGGKPQVKFADEKDRPTI